MNFDDKIIPIKSKINYFTIPIIHLKNLLKCKMCLLSRMLEQSELNILVYFIKIKCKLY